MYYVYIEPKILCLRYGFHPKYSYKIEFIIDGAVDYVPSKFVHHFFIIKNTRYPTVVINRPIFGSES